MKELVVIIIKYLKKQLQDNSLSSDAAEGVEVAVQCLENAYGVTPEDVQLCPIALEEVFASAFQPTEAGRVVTQEQKEEAESLKLIGNKLMKDGSYTEAIGYYTRALELDPKNPVYFCNRAAAHIQSHNYLASINDCHEAIRLDPSYSKAHSRLGYAYQAVGNRVKAKEHYGKALELEPENESYKSCYQKLAEQGTSSSQHASDLMGMLPNIDLSAIMKNPSFVEMASQMLEDPGMQNAVSRILSGQSTFPVSQVEELISAGQQLVDRLQNQPETQRTGEEGTTDDQISLDSEYPSSTDTPYNTPRFPTTSTSNTDDDTHPDSTESGGERQSSLSSTPREDDQGPSGKGMGDRGDHL